MGIISDFMIRQHKQCDDVFARAEAEAGSGDWSGVERDLGEFLRAMERHFAMEEKVFFPGFEERTGMTMGPTQVMRMEHEQMRSMFGQMREAGAAADAEQFLGLSETLLVLMQQHNMKEESILYTMMDQSLAAEAGELIARAEALAA